MSVIVSKLTVYEPISYTLVENKLLSFINKLNVMLVEVYVVQKAIFRVDLENNFTKWII